MTMGTIAAGVVLLVVAVLVVTLLVTRNGLIRKRNRVRAAYAAIDVQLTRRHEVIPRWVAAVKAAFDHERAVLERVAAAAAQARRGDVAALAAAENELTAAVAVVERYPELHANQNVMRLHEDLLSTENRVAFARQHYNDETMLFNNAVQAFPRTLVAAMFGIRPASYLELTVLGE